MKISRRTFMKSLAVGALSLGLSLTSCVHPMTAYVFDIRKIPIIHRYTILSMQGILNKHFESGGVYCIWEHSRYFYNREIHKPETQKWLEIYNVELQHIDLTFLINLVKKYTDKYVIYDPEFIHSINVAATIAGIEDAVIVHPKAEEFIKKYGFTRLLDLRDTNKRYWQNDVVKCYEWQYNELFDFCNKDEIVYCGGTKWQIDYAISKSLCCIELDPADPNQSELLLKYYKKIKYYGVNVGYPKIGKLERPMVEHASKAGLRTILMPSLRGAPIAFNYSFHCRMPKVKVKQEVPIEKDYKGDKVYLTFALSDLGLGMLQGFYYDQWHDPFRLSEKRTVKMDWWMDALALDYAPQIVKYFFDTKHPKLDTFYSAHVYGRIRPSDFPNLPDYLNRGKDKIKEMGLRVVAFSNHKKWDEYVFKTYSEYLKDCVDGFIFGFGPEFGDIQYIIREGMPWVFTTFLYHGDPWTARKVYDYIKRHDFPQFLVYGCAFGYQIPYGKVVQRLQYIQNYLRDKLGDKIVFVNASELMRIVQTC